SSRRRSCASRTQSMAQGGIVREAAAVGTSSFCTKRDNVAWHEYRMDAQRGDQGMPMSNEMGVHPALVTALLGLCAALGAVGCGSTSNADLVATNGVTGSGGDGASNSSTTEAATSAAGTTSVKGASGTNG